MTRVRKKELLLFVLKNGFHISKKLMAGIAEKILGKQIYPICVKDPEPE